MISMDKIKITERKPNPQMGYKAGFRWCGFCGGARLANEKNRCAECGRALRGRKRN
jgi:hypothetical protein